MREIKFRAWDGRRFMYSFTKKGQDRLGWFFSTMPGFKKEQFTGLLDKNGREIYEGDCVRFEVHDGAVVIWNNVCACFEFKAIKHYCESDISLPCEVIGNIHENHELLS